MGSTSSCCEEDLGPTAGVAVVAARAVRGRVTEPGPDRGWTRAWSGARADVDASHGPVAKASRQTEVWIRLLDICGAWAILIPALPIMLMAMLLIRITSGKPVFYRQERVGKAGQLFTLYKLRTMVNDAEKRVGPIWASHDDDRITPIGRLLRKVRLDEFPQLYNVLRGDMSLVGPRPERPFFVARYEVLQGVRLAVRPGLTGLAQVRSSYDLPPAHKVKYDRLYIRNRSLPLNCRILLCTIPVVLGRKGW